MKNGICPRCQSQKVVRDAIKTNSHPTMISGRSGLLVDNVKGFNIKSMEAYICCDCGFTELYVVNPASLWKKHGEKSFSDE